MKKIGVFGCKSTTIFLLESLRKTQEISCVITISPEAGAKNEVADYTNVVTYCEKYKITHYVAKRYDLKCDEDREAFKEMGLDIAFVIGWQRLIPREILQTFSIGVFGMHGSTDDLPLGRGRSPMNWALLERRSHFFTNIFRYDPGVDSGDILDTFVFSLQSGDTAETMHYKNVLAMKTLILKNMDNLLNRELNLNKQKDLPPTYYPKRSPRDSIIDWQRDVHQLEAFIRAVTRPFNGAFSYLDGEKVIIWRAALFETDLVDYGYRDERWGTIVEVFPSGKFLVNCRGGLLIVHEFETRAELGQGKVLESPADQIKHFELNRSGYHDLDE